MLIVASGPFIMVSANHLRISDGVDTVGGVVSWN